MKIVELQPHGIVFFTMSSGQTITTNKEETKQIDHLELKHMGVYVQFRETKRNSKY